MEPDDDLAAIRARKLAELQRLAEQRARAALAPAAPVDLTSATFAGFVRDNPVAVVDCWAAWCGPCRTMEPVVAGLARELAGRVAFGKLNVDEHPDVAGAYGVRSIPTFLVFRHGALADQLVGAMPAAAMRARLGA